MSSQANVMQTWSKARVQQENANLAHKDDCDRVSNLSSEGPFILSMVDTGRGDLFECASCNRPDKSERYMVECQKCTRWYHFCCASVSTATVRATSFVCVSCMQKEISGEQEPAQSQVSGIFSTSSARTTRVARELRRLDEEQQLLEKLSREKFEKERALQERELQEKMEREKQFIARKHELLSRQDDEEGKSVHSVRSSQRNAKRTEDWVKQTKTAVNEVIVPGSMSASAGQPDDTTLGNLQGIHPSSTPLKTGESVVPVITVDDDGTGSEGKSIPRAEGDTTVGENVGDSFEDLAKDDVVKRSQFVFPSVDLKPYADLLIVEEVPSTGVNPKHLGVEGYKPWSMETQELRNQNALKLQQQAAAEHRAMEELTAKHRWEIDKKQKWEFELVNQVTNRQSQHAGELALAREREVSWRSKLQKSEREQEILEKQIETVTVEFERMRTSEADLRQQLKQRDGGEVALKKQFETLEMQLVEMRERTRTVEADRRDQLDRCNRDPDRMETLVSFGLVVQNLWGHLRAVGLERHLGNPTLLQDLVDKMPATVQFSWALYQEQVPVVDLNVFCVYMTKISSAVSGLTPLASITQKPGRDERVRQKKRSFVNTHVSANPPKMNRREEEKAGSSGGKEKKSGTGTNGSKSCSVGNVDNHQIENSASFKGMNLNGRWEAVKVNKFCGRCLTSHARCPCKGEVCGMNDCPKRHHRLLHFDPPSTTKTTSATVNVHRQMSSSTLFRILPVTLFGKNGQVDNYAFFDDASSVTRVEQSTADALGIRGEMETLHIDWPGGFNKIITGAEVVTMKISEAGGTKRFKLSKVYTVDNLGLPEQTTDYAELSAQFVHLQKLPVKSFKYAVPGILNGQSNCHLLAVLKLREGKPNEPFAAKTRIGWAVCGTLRKPQASTKHTQLHMYAEPATVTVDLLDYARSFFEIESLGVAIVPAVKGDAEERANKILEATTRRTSNVEIGLLWKYDCNEFPESQLMADSGYEYEATEKEIAGFDLRRTLYLPIGVVVDSIALLYPYRDSPEQPMKTMVSYVANSGAACSPTYFEHDAKNLNATEQEAELPRGAAAVKQRHYDDDEVIEVHKRVGFNIGNWMSSDRSVKLGEANLKQPKVILPEKEMAFERVLGTAWIQEKDVFVFSLQNGFTKREMLRLVMSICYPLGLVATFVIHGKILIQEVWRTDTDWNSILVQFATRWVVEYLPTIIKRTKWFRDIKPIKVGDLVLVADENIKNRWMRGRVIRTTPGKDGIARRAEVQTSSGVFKRPATMLAVLDVDGSGDAEPEVKATRGGDCSPHQPIVQIQ